MSIWIGGCVKESICGWMRNWWISGWLWGRIEKVWRCMDMKMNGWIDGWMYLKEFMKGLFEWLEVLWV